jgi:hypothetical protein
VRSPRLGTAGVTMRDPSVTGEAQVEASGQDSGDRLDNAGRSILRLLQKAAGVAEENSQYAMEAAHKLSHQLRAAQDRIARLEAEMEEQRDRAARAEQWLHKVYLEIEDRFLREKK